MSDVDEIEELEWRRNRAMDPQVQGSGDGAGEGTGSRLHFHLTGLPWETTEEDVRDFLQRASVVPQVVRMAFNTQGDAFVQVGSQSDAEAVTGLHRQNIGRRFVEISKISAIEFANALEQYPYLPDGSTRSVLQLKGVPFEAHRENIREFLEGFQLRDDTDDSITYKLKPDGRPDGGVFVNMASEEEALAAQKAKNKAMLLDRAVELRQTTMGELYTCLNAHAAKGLGPQSDRLDVVKVKGLPFEATAGDVDLFFTNYQINDGRIFMVTLPNGKFSGEAFVEFVSEREASRAVTEMDGKEMAGRSLRLKRSTRAECYLVTQPHIMAAELAECLPGEDANVVKLWGLSFDAKPDDLIEFLKPFPVQKHGVFMIHDHKGRPSGDAYVVMETVEAAAGAIKEKDHKTILRRWVGVEASAKQQLLADVFRKPFAKDTAAHSGPLPEDTCVYIKGLEAGATKERVANFFAEFQPVSIHHVPGTDGALGRAWVKFPTTVDAFMALSKNKMMLGEKYLDLFICTEAEAARFLDRGEAFISRGSGGGGGSRARGRRRGRSRAASPPGRRSRSRGRRSPPMARRPRSRSRSRSRDNRPSRRSPSPGRRRSGSPGRDRGRRSRSPPRRHYSSRRDSYDGYPPMDYRGHPASPRGYIDPRYDERWFGGPPPMIPDPRMLREAYYPPEYFVRYPVSPRGERYRAPPGDYAPSGDRDSPSRRQRHSRRSRSRSNERSRPYDDGYGRFEPPMYGREHYLPPPYGYYDLPPGPPIDYRGGSRHSPPRRRSRSPPRRSRSRSRTRHRSPPRR